MMEKQTTSVTPSSFSFEDLTLGASAESTYQVTPEIFDSFLECFGDFNPLHTDTKYAQSQGYPKNIMHGAMLNGFLSHFIGMIFPGKNTLLLSSEVHHHGPFFEGDMLLLKSRVVQRIDAENVIVMQFRFCRGSSEIAKGRLTLKIRNVG